MTITVKVLVTWVRKQNVLENFKLSDVEDVGNGLVMVKYDLLLQSKAFDCNTHHKLST